VARVRVTRVPGGEGGDVVAVEEPLELRIGGVPVAVTMRTPGHDEELALGFSIAEGLSPVAARVPEDFPANTIEIEAPGADLGRLQRNFYTSSSCGVCGKGALEAVAVAAPRVESRLTASAALVAELPDRLRAAQPAFKATGGLHATGLFTAAGELVCVREDVEWEVELAFADSDPLVARLAERPPGAFRERLAAKPRERFRRPEPRRRPTQEQNARQAWIRHVSV